MISEENMKTQGTNWLYARKTRIRLHIAIIGEPSIFSLKSPKTSFLAVRAHFLAFPNLIFWMRNPKLILVLKLDSHSENSSVGPVCNPWPIQLYAFGGSSFSLLWFRRQSLQTCPP